MSQGSSSFFVLLVVAVVVVLLVNKYENNDTKSNRGVKLKGNFGNDCWIVNDTQATIAGTIQVDSAWCKHKDFRMLPHTVARVINGTRCKPIKIIVKEITPHLPGTDWLQASFPAKDGEYITVVSQEATGRYIVNAYNNSEGRDRMPRWSFDVMYAGYTHYQIINP